jgi:hypothetical protein
MSESISWMKRPIACFLAAILVVPLAQAATDTLPSAPLPQVATGQQQSQPNATAAPPAQQTGQQQNPAPVGTAAAPVVKPEGTAASRPAGAAIAPAKQKRRHTIAIRVALLVGGAVAIGTVAAASLGTSAKPH